MTRSRRSMIPDRSLFAAHSRRLRQEAVEKRTFSFLIWLTSADGGASPLYSLSFIEYKPLENWNPAVKTHSIVCQGWAKAYR
jgi:hypothetical protein